MSESQEWGGVVHYLGSRGHPRCRAHLGVLQGVRFWACLGFGAREAWISAHTFPDWTEGSAVLDRSFGLVGGLRLWPGIR